MAVVAEEPVDRRLSPFFFAKRLPIVSLPFVIFSGTRQEYGTDRGPVFLNAINPLNPVKGVVRRDQITSTAPVSIL